MPSALFTPIQLRGLKLSNRIVISPLCQYSALEGTAQPWHWMHIGHFAISGAGLVIMEATGVSAIGRISPQCLGLYSDENEAALTRLIRDLRTFSDTPIGIQLDHAGRKASTRPTWELWKGHGVPREEGGWPPVGPSPEAYTTGWQVPLELNETGLKRVRDEFVESARRAARCGFASVEIHCAHGYLLHEFMSPLTNHRNDAYGGSTARRMRFPLEVAEAMRAAWPAERPLGIRITAEDWVEGGLSLDDAVVFAHELRQIGIDYLTPSAGNLAPGMKVPQVGPGYMVPFAERIKQETGITTMTVGMIVGAEQANTIIESGKADMVAIGRAIMDDPRWPWHAAAKLGDKIEVSPQYARCTPQHWPAYPLVHGGALREGEGAMGHATRE
jgi:2,4-dienoyl-CoA reductase-like NADH-dependent reductase (Old Yellow Enzyme family)